MRPSSVFYSGNPKDPCVVGEGLKCGQWQESLHKLSRASAVTGGCGGEGTRAETSWAFREGHSEYKLCKRTLTRKEKTKVTACQTELKVCTPHPNLLFSLLCYVSSRDHAAGSFTDIL